MAQPNIIFQNIGMQNGMSYNIVNNISIDKRGRLWIATNRGVSVFNGHTIEKFMVEDYPDLQSNLISRVLCDSSNRIWIQSTDSKLSMMDESRNVHRIGLYDKNEFIPCHHVMNAPDNYVPLKKIRFTKTG